MHKKKWGVLTAICAAIAVFFFLFYSGFINQKIYENSSRHLQEVYRQVNGTFTSVVSQNYNLLTSWGEYLSNNETEDDEWMADMIRAGKGKWNFTDFFFIGSSGDYMNLDGEYGHIDLGQHTEHGLWENGYVIANSKSHDEYRKIVFAVPVESGKFDGFSYTALGICYDEHDLEAILNISAYEGTAHCYVVYPDGQILFSAHAHSDHSDNYMDYLQEKAVFQNGSIEGLHQVVQDRAEGTFGVKIGDNNYFLIYQDIPFQNWGLLGLVPQKIVNAQMVEIQRMTIGMVALIFLLIAAVGFWYVYWRKSERVRKKEQELEHRAHMFEVLVSRASDVFILFSAKDYTVEYVSPNIEELLGISAEEVRQDIRRLLDTGKQRDVYPSEEQIHEMPMEKSTDLIQEYIHQKNGNQLWYKETLYHFKMEGKSMYMLVMSDRTREMQSQRQLETTMELVKSANESKSIFLSNMSHDIRTPMNAIIGFSNLLKQDAENPAKVRDYTRKISSAGQHLLNLINDVLDMSKIESGKTTLNMTEFNLGEILEDISVVFQPQFDKKEQNFEIRVSGIYSDQFVGDRLRINQILHNLLSNAMKYTQEGGQIELVITQLKYSGHISRLRFEVIDNGMGMSPEYLDIIFESFSREENTTISGIQGTGLGMAITKSLVDLMGGTISVKSEKNTGSTFTVELDLQVTESKADKVFWSDHKIRKILVMDEEKEIHQGIERMMAKTGVNITCTEDESTMFTVLGEAARDNVPCDLILLGWKDTDAERMKTVRQLREVIGHQVPLIVMTACDWGDIEQDALTGGVDGFMSKPFFITNLRMLIQQIKSRQEQENDPSEEYEALTGKHFLVAEDNELNAEILMELLELEGVTCDLAVNGEEALKLFCASEPGFYDAILMDVQMPVMDGYTATRSIRLCNHPDAKKIPITAMTANAFAGDVQNALQAGMNAHVAKPIDMNILKNTILKLLTEKRG